MFKPLNSLWATMLATASTLAGLTYVLVSIQMNRSGGIGSRHGMAKVWNEYFFVFLVIPFGIGLLWGRYIWLKQQQKESPSEKKNKLLEYSGIRGLIDAGFKFDGNKATGILQGFRFYCSFRLNSFGKPQLSLRIPLHIPEKTNPVPLKGFQLRGNELVGEIPNVTVRFHKDALAQHFRSIAVILQDCGWKPAGDKSEFWES